MLTHQTDYHCCPEIDHRKRAQLESQQTLYKKNRGTFNSYLGPTLLLPSKATRKLTLVSIQCRNWKIIIIIMRILQLIFLDLLLCFSGVLGEKLTKEEKDGILPQREKETHFPAMPNMPNMFILVSGIYKDIDKKFQSSFIC